MKRLFTAFALTALLSPAAQAEDILSVLKQKSKVERPAPPSVNPYNYTVDVMMSGKENKDDSDSFIAKLLVDPSAAPEQRVTIISTSSEDYTEDFEEFLNDMRDAEKSPEDLAEEFWCESGDNDLFDDDDISADVMTLVSETDTEVVIKPNLALMAEMMMDADENEDMSKSDRKMMKKMMKRLDGEFVISKADARLQRMKIWLTRPMTVKLIAKLKEMEVTQSCAMAPNGFRYRDSMTMHVKAKALGIGIEQNMDVKISGLTPR